MRPRNDRSWSTVTGCKKLRILSTFASGMDIFPSPTTCPKYTNCVQPHAHLLGLAVNPALAKQDMTQSRSRKCWSQDDENTRTSSTKGTANSTVTQNLINQPLEGGGRIPQPERHADKLKLSHRGKESSLGPGLRSKQDLIKSLGHVELGEVWHTRLSREK